MDERSKQEIKKFIDALRDHERREIQLAVDAKDKSQNCKNVKEGFLFAAGVCDAISRIIEAYWKSKSHYFPVLNRYSTAGMALAALAWAAETHYLRKHHAAISRKTWDKMKELIGQINAMRNQHGDRSLITEEKNRIYKSVKPPKHLAERRLGGRGSSSGR